MLCLGAVLTAAGDDFANTELTAKIHPVAPPKAIPFPLQDVRLLDGMFKDGQDVAVKYLLSLEPDRFLANFRKEAGLPPKAKQYGGWESEGVSGHAGGHYLSACAIAYAATGDKRFLDRVNYFVSELAACQRANGNGYVAAIPNGKKIYAEVAAGDIRVDSFGLNGGWVPNYTLHKLFAGLRDAYRLCGNANALEVSQNLADWLEKTLSGLNDEQMQKILGAEHGGMNETMADLYADTGDERYLKLSRRFHHKAVLDPLARGEDIIDIACLGGVAAQTVVQMIRFAEMLVVAMTAGHISMMMHHALPEKIRCRAVAGIAGEFVARGEADEFGNLRVRMFAGQNVLATRERVENRLVMKAT